MDVLDLIKKEGLRRGLSHRTISSYCYCVKLFMKACSKDPKRITKRDIKDYASMLIEKGYCGNTLNVYISALKFFFEEILCRKLLLYIKYSKVPKELPTVLTKEEVRILFNAIRNKKHSLMIRLMYSAGLRLSELANLKIKDLEFDKNYGWVRKGKGNKDRLFVIASSLQSELKGFAESENLEYEDWLFRGRNSHISQKTIYEIVKRAAKKTGIKKNVHPHTLRHSFATHLIEDGYDIASVQSLLGHNSSETTMRYIHMASPKLINVKSPYDTLNQNTSHVDPESL